MDFAKRNISVFAEVICLSVNLVQRKVTRISRKVVTRSVVITSTVVVLIPGTLCHTSFIKLILYTIDRIFSGYGSLGIGAEIMPVLIYLYPSACQGTKFGIIPLSFNLHQARILALALSIVAKVIVYSVHCIDTGDLLTVYVIVVVVPSVSYCYTVYVFLTVTPNAIEQFAAGRALKYIVSIAVAVSRSRNGCSPINYRIAVLAECSPCITCLCAGRSLVGKTGGCMFMP